MLLHYSVSLHGPGCLFYNLQFRVCPSVQTPGLWEDDEVSIIMGKFPGMTSFIVPGLSAGMQLGCLRADLQIYIREFRACFISLTTLTHIVSKSLLRQS